MPESMVRVLIVDDHALIRLAMQVVLERQIGVQVVGQAADGDAALDQARALRPDIVLLDIDMPGMNGIEATQRLVELDPAPKVVVVSVHDRSPYPQQALEAGAHGYLSKGADAERLHDALQTVLLGGQYLDPRVAQAITDQQDTGLPAGITPREMQVVVLLDRGCSPTDIGRALHISRTTVSAHRCSVVRKLGVQTSSEVFGRLRQMGFDFDAFIVPGVRIGPRLPS